MNDKLIKIFLEMIAEQNNLTSYDDNSLFKINKSYIIRTITYHFIGRVKSIDKIGENIFLSLESACWLAESARWMDTLKTGKINEAEPYPDEVSINISSIIDFAEWKHPLILNQI